MIRRGYALGALALGLALVGAGMAEVLPGAVVVLGASVAFFGLLAAGLSFIPAHRPRADAPPPMSAFERVAGLFYAPSGVFQNLRAHPRWLAGLLVVTLSSFVYSTAFTQRVTPERIVSHMNGKLVETGWVKPEQADKMREAQLAEARDPVRVWGGAVGQFAGAFVIAALVAGLLMLAVLAFGGRIDFWQALAVAVHASLPPFVIKKLLSLLLLYLKSPADIHPLLNADGLVQDNLGALFSPAERPVLFAFASAFGLLSFYGLWLLATGLRHGSERLGRTSAWSIALIFWGVRLLFAVAAAAAFGGFMA